MTEPRLAGSVLVSALLRRAEAEGGFGTVLAKGDSTAGAVAVILLEKGANPRFLERLLQPGSAPQIRPRHLDFGTGYRISRTVRR